MSSLNATTSSGIVATADNTGTLQLQSAGTTVANITSTGLAVTGALTTNGIVSSPYAMKNRIINGDMQISQRNAAASHTLPAGNTYGIDRWFIGVGTASVTGQQVAGSGSFPNAYRITGGAGNTGVFFSQRIESANIADLVNTTVTVQIRLSASAITSIVWDAYAATATNNFTSLTSIAGGTISGITSTPNTFTFSFNAGANAANGVQLTFTIGAMTSGTITITGVQLEQGSTATSYEWLPIGTELALCQRYFQQYASDASSAGFICNAYNDTSTRAFGVIQFPVIMRTPPSLTVVSGTAFGVYAIPLNTLPCTSIALLSASTMPSSIALIFNVGSGLTAGQGTVVKDNGTSANGRIQLSAEL